MQVSPRKLLVTGAAGFIGSVLVRSLINATDHRERVGTGEPLATSAPTR